MISSIPIKVLQNRSLSLLESIVKFLKEEENMNFHEIGILLNRDERNIWTVYTRSKNKKIYSEVKYNSKEKINLNKEDNFENKGVISIYGVNK